jgi:hypothetical protein
MTDVPSTWEELASRLGAVETRFVDVAADFYRGIDSEYLTPQTAIRVDREIVEAQRRLRWLKEVVADATAVDEGGDYA